MNMTGQSSVEYSVKSFVHGSKNDVGGSYITNLALGFLFGFVVLFLQFSKLVSRADGRISLHSTNSEVGFPVLTSSPSFVAGWV